MKKVIWIGIFCLIVAGLISACDFSGSSEEKREAAMEQLYRLGLDNYLQEQLDLLKYDELLRDSELDFLPTEDGNVTRQQKSSMMGMKYLYIRNDIYLNRLSREDYALLRDTADQYKDEITKDTEIPGEIQDMIIRTFHAVIAPNEIRTEEDRNVLTAFDTSGTKMFTNSSVVIYIATEAAFDERGEYIDEKKEQDKKELLDILCSQMEAEFDGVIEDTPIRVFSDICYDTRVK